MKHADRTDPDGKSPSTRVFPAKPDRRAALALCCAWPWLHAAAAWADTQLQPVSDETWRDAARSRDMPVRIRWPVAAGRAGPMPVVMYSHGLGGSREGGAVWGAAWAAAGFAVLHLQHPGSDLAAVRAAIGSGNGLRSTMAPSQLVARIGDVSFALDEIERRHHAGLARWPQVRPRAVGMAGHSFGAHTTLAMAGQRFLNGQSVSEPRLAAFIALSPSVPAAGDARQAYAGMQRPLLCLTGTRDDDVVGNGATPEQRRAVFAALPPGNNAQLVLQDADHATFGGQHGLPLRMMRPRAPQAESRQPEHHALVAAITTDWWRATLQADAAARARLLSPPGLSPGDAWQRK